MGCVAGRGHVRPTRSRSSTTFSIESGVASGARASDSCWFSRWMSRKVRLRRSSVSSIAVPMAPHQAYSSGTSSSSSFSPKRLAQGQSSRRCSGETAPMSATGGADFRPLTMLLLKLRATASHSPRRISGGE